MGFGFMSVEIAGHNIDIELIVDIVVILIIICITIYTTRVKNKSNNGKGVKYIDGKIGIDEQKGYIVETNVKKNIEKYNKIKGSIRGFLNIGSLTLLTLFITCLSLFPIRDSSYELIKGNTDMEIIVLLVVSLIFLLLCIYIFSLINKILILRKRNKFSYVFMRLSILMLVFTIMFFIGRYFPLSINENLKLSEGISAFTELFISLLLVLLVIYLLSYHISKIEPTDKIHKNLGYNTLKILFITFTAGIITISGWFVGPLICNALGLGDESSVIELLITVTSIIGGFTVLIQVSQGSSDENIVCNTFKIVVALLITNTIIILGWSGVPFICKMLGLSVRLSVITRLLLGILSTIGGFYILIKMIKKYYINKGSTNHELYNSETEDNSSIVNDENTNKELTYDELIDNNKKLEKKTGFHQGSLF